MRPIGLLTAIGVERSRGSWVALGATRKIKFCIGNSLFWPSQRPLLAAARRVRVCVLLCMFHKNTDFKKVLLFVQNASKHKTWWDSGGAQGRSSRRRREKEDEEEAQTKSTKRQRRNGSSRPPTLKRRNNNSNSNSSSSSSISSNSTNNSNIDTTSSNSISNSTNNNSSSNSNDSSSNNNTKLFIAMIINIINNLFLKTILSYVSKQAGFLASLGSSLIYDIII